ncbi:unnamed protein product, partial [Mesorhabditis belari]|uniref:Protein quiver n=1 Tax=Mesorhabditis belari TaxID=2138241 RepID=A0AAF3EVJ8_9BILA
MSPKIFLFTVFVALLSVSEAKKCYNCTSYDPHCDDNYARYLIDCPQLTAGLIKAQQAIGCRKIDQWVDGEHTMFRECAYTGKDYKDRQHKGSLGITRITNQCSNRDGCNPATMKTFGFLSVLTVILGLIRW